VKFEQVIGRVVDSPSCWAGCDVNSLGVERRQRSSGGWRLQGGQSALIVLCRVPRGNLDVQARWRRVTSRQTSRHATRKFILPTAAAAAAAAATAMRIGL